MVKQKILSGSMDLFEIIRIRHDNIFSMFDTGSFSVV